MPCPVRSPLLRYGCAFVTVALMTGVWVGLRPAAIQHRPFVTFYFAVIFTAWYAGLGPSVAAILLSCLSVAYFFLPPIFEFAVSDPNDLVATGMFITVCSAIIAFSEANRAARRRLEREVADRKVAEEELRQSDRRKEEFLAVLSHELRNPLAPIQTAVELLEQAGTIKVGSERELAMIKRQVQNLKRLVDDLLDVSRISRGKIELRKEVVELAPVVVQAVEAVRPFFNDHRQELHVSIPEKSICMEADSTRLEQVLFNLLLNAAKYTPEGGRIWLEVEQFQRQVVIRVRDTGIGIEPELLPKVFDLFLQGERRSGRSHAGSGIGLSLAKNLVELHGGTITADSQGPDMGSEFVVRLPVIVRAQSERVQPPQVVQSDISETLPSRRILIVDDNVQAADSLGRLISVLFGQEVRVVYNGKSALKIAGSFRPEVILLDLEMTGMDGYEVAMRFREHSEFSKVLIVAVTGWGYEDDRRRSREMGFDLHLVKPVTARDLRQMFADLKPKLEKQALPELVPDLAHS